MDWITNGIIFTEAEINWATNINWGVHTLWTTLVFIIVGYLVGSILVSRFYISVFRKGNTTFEKNGKLETMDRFGTSKTYYYMGFKMAFLEFLWDFGKPILFFWCFMYPLWAFVPAFNHAIISLGFLAVFAGHLWPVYWKFNGGVGIATGVGILITINWLAGVIGFSSWLIFTVITKDSGTGGFFGALVGALLLFIPVMMDNPMMFYVFRSDAQFIYMSIIILLLMIVKMYNRNFFKRRIYNHFFDKKNKKNKTLNDESKLDEVKNNEEIFTENINEQVKSIPLNKGITQIN